MISTINVGISWKEAAKKSFNDCLFIDNNDKPKYSKSELEQMKIATEKRRKAEIALENIALRKECDYFDEILREFGF